MFIAAVNVFDKEKLHPFVMPTLDEAIRVIGTTTKLNGELLEELTSADGVKTRVKLADIVSGKWIIRDDRRLTMKKVKKATESSGKRDVVADLIGDGKLKKATPENLKKAKVKAKSAAALKTKAVKDKKPKVGRAPAFTDIQTIKVVGDGPKFKTGGENEKILKLLKKSATIGAYRKARVKAGMDDKVGGLLHWLLKNGHIKIK